MAGAPRRQRRRRWTGSLALGLLCIGFLTAGACRSAAAPHPLGPTGQATQPAPGGSIREFDLTAVSALIELGPGVKVHAWTYNGTVPGPTIRATVGDLVRVRLTNRLSEGTTINWHGLSVPNGEDGVAGVTQDPVLPGQTVTFAFVASTSGTYWYHSFTRAFEQVDRGLYGPLIIDPLNEAALPAVDQTLIYDEWPWGLEKSSAPPPTDPLMVSYVNYSVNGRTGAAIAPVHVQPGRLVRLRLVNAGFETHFVQVDDTAVTSLRSMDAQ
jgi:FtsP/CotA-like multicopper oxidase with cupredoxin domain